MKIYLGADHNGFQYKQDISAFLQASGHEVVEEGNVSIDPNDDFPQFAAKVAYDLLASGDTEARGLLLCGSGQGIVHGRQSLQRDSGQFVLEPRNCPRQS